MSEIAQQQHFRWLAKVTYLTDSGPSEVEHHVEELEELHELVERGPDWNCIAGIEIRLNPRRRSYSVSIEQAARQ